MVFVGRGIRVFVLGLFVLSFLVSPVSSTASDVLPLEHRIIQEATQKYRGKEPEDIFYDSKKPDWFFHHLLTVSPELHDIYASYLYALAVHPDPPASGREYFDALAERGDEKSFSILREIINNSQDSEVRTAAGYRIEKAPFRQMPVSELIQRLETETDLEQLSSLLAEAGRRNDANAINSIVKHLSHRGFINIRQIGMYASRALGEIENSIEHPAVIAFETEQIELIRANKNPDEVGRSLQQLSHIKSQKLRDLILQIQSNESYYNSSYFYIVCAANELRLPLEIENLDAFLQRGDDRYRYIVGKNLGLHATSDNWKSIMEKMTDREFQLNPILSGLAENKINEVVPLLVEHRRDDLLETMGTPAAKMGLVIRLISYVEMMKEEAPIEKKLDSIFIMMNAPFEEIAALKIAEAIPYLFQMLDLYVQHWETINDIGLHNALANIFETIGSIGGTSELSTLQELMKPHQREVIRLGAAITTARIKERLQVGPTSTVIRTPRPVHSSDQRLALEVLQGGISKISVDEVGNLMIQGSSGEKVVEDSNLADAILLLAIQQGLVVEFANTHVASEKMSRIKDLKCVQKKCIVKTTTTQLLIEDGTGAEVLLLPLKSETAELETTTLGETSTKVKIKINR